MNALWALLLALAFALPGNSQLATRDTLTKLLGFENGQPGRPPLGWGNNPTNTAFIDGQIQHSGKYSARLERTSASAGNLSTLSQGIAVDFTGNRLEWRGFLRTESVSNYAALFVQEFNSGGVQVGFASSQGQNLRGANGWKEYSITMPASSEARILYFGVILSGVGKAWVDDLQLLLDGQSLAIVTPLDTDREFDTGSGIAVTSLTDTQVQNLSTLARVWGFLKYHHPAVAAGGHHWDYELFRILPSVLNASDAASATGAMATWVDALGPVTPCSPCATLTTDNLSIAPRLEWISDTALLGADLSAALQNIYASRPAGPSQFYISLDRYVSNPSFDHELTYDDVTFPDCGYQLLALFRFWNMVQYFSPNREIMADDAAAAPTYWNQVLLESIPRLALAADTLSYKQEMLRFIARINDTHANLWSSLDARPPIGACALPVTTRFVEGRAVVLRYVSPAGPSSGLLPGDIIEKLDGIPVSELVARWTPFYADSNQAARMRDMGIYLSRGPCGPASVTISRGDEISTLTSDRVPWSSLDTSRTYHHDLPPPPFQLLSPDVAYLNVGYAVSADSEKYIEAAARTKGLILDIRNYPSDFPLPRLAPLLISRTTEFAAVTLPDVSNPGAFHWDHADVLEPAKPHYDGKVVILVDEVTQSSAEFHAMGFRTVPESVVIGSTTAGADGNVSTVPLPGNLSSYLSGIGIFYPDKRPTQRIGIVPDIEVKPTIAGIRAGRDEVLEAAIQLVTGRPE